MTKKIGGLLKGQVGQWRNQPTCTVRVPQKFKKPLLDFAKGLDTDSPIAPLDLLPLKELSRISGELPSLIDRRKRETRDKLVTENFGLARSVAHRISNHPHCPFSYEDMEQQAFLALVVAAEHYEPDRGNKFSTFAIPKIRGKLLNYIRDKGTGIKIPRGYYDLYFKAIKLERELGSLKAVADRLNIPLQTLQDAYRSVESCYRNEPITDARDWQDSHRQAIASQITIPWEDAPEAQQIKDWLSGRRINAGGLRALLLSLPVQFDRAQ